MNKTLIKMKNKEIHQKMMNGWRLILRNSKN